MPRWVKLNYFGRSEHIFRSEDSGRYVDVTPPHMRGNVPPMPAVSVWEIDRWIREGYAREMSEEEVKALEGKDGPRPESRSPARAKGD